MSGSTSLVSSTPGYVTNASGYGGQDVRAGTMINDVPGLFASGDFAVSQRGAGAAMSVDISQGRALIDPQQATHQGLYVVRRTSGSAFNTSADGGYTWTAADPTNARIDLLCIEIKDTDMDASGVTGWRFRVVDGTPSASATHQLEVAQWPAIPSGCMPIAAIRVPAAATTLTTANITSLNPIAGSRTSVNAISTLETTTSTTLVRLTTPDFVFGYVPANSRAKLFYESLWKGSTATPTFGAAVFINGVQSKLAGNNGAPSASVVSNAPGSGGTFYNRLTSTSSGLVGGGGAGFSADSSDVATGMNIALSTQAIEFIRLPSGWYLFETRYSISTGTLSVQNRESWLEVAAAA